MKYSCQSGGDTYGTATRSMAGYGCMAGSLCVEHR